MPTKKGSSKASKTKKSQAKVRRAKPSARKGRAGGKRATAQRAARSTNVAIGSGTRQWMLAPSRWNRRCCLTERKM